MRPAVARNAVLVVAVICALAALPEHGYPRGAYAAANSTGSKKDKAAPPVIFDEHWQKQTSPDVTAAMARDVYSRLAKWGWSAGALRRALAVCKRDKVLFEKYVDLVTQKRVSIPTVEACLKACRGDPKTIDEYWDYVETKKFRLAEVHQVFDRFPPNPIIRWQYFFHRTAGYQKMPGDPDASKRTRSRNSAPAIYSQRECMGVFRNTRSNITYVKEYFALRDAGKSPAQAMAPVKKKVLADIEKEKEEKRLAEEELKRKKDAERQAIRDAEAREKKRREEAAAGREKKAPLAGADEVRDLWDSLPQDQDKPTEEKPKPEEEEAEKETTEQDSEDD